MDIKYLKNVLLYTCSALLSICLILYIGYHLVNTWGVKVTCARVELASVNQTVALDAYIMREETVLYADTFGNLGQTAADGEKVRKNQEVSKIYSNPDTEIRAQLSDLDAQLALLRESADASYLTVSDTTKLDAAISAMLLRIKSEIEENHLSHAVAIRSELLGSINKRDIVTQTGLASGSYVDQIVALEAERRALVSQLSTVLLTVYTSVSGYYYASTDGYETIFSADKVDTMTLDEFAAYTKAEPALNASLTRTVAGKIVEDYVWYIACPSDKSTLTLFTEGNQYCVTFPNNPDCELDMTLHRVISQTDSDDIVLIFRTSVLPNDFNYTRLQPVEVVETVHEGFRVPLSAVRMVDGVQGVYVLEGNLVRFRKIRVIYEADGYVVIDENGDGENTGGWLELHDNVIIEGRGLFDGKIIL